MCAHKLEPEAKKAKITSPSPLSDALFGAPAPSSLSATLFGGGGATAKDSQEGEGEAEAAPVAGKPSPGSRKMTPPRKNRTAAAASDSPFNATVSARFASQSTELRQRNLTQEMEMGPEDADDEEEKDDDDGGSGGDANDEEDASEEYYAEQYEQEEEGPDGLTHSERLYLEREYETTTLTEREWLIRQRRRRITGDAQIQTLSLCTEVVGAGSFLPVKLWRDSAPDVIAANSKARKLTSATGNAEDPYDLLHSDDEAEGDRSLVLKRQQALSMCQTIMSNVGLLVIRHARPEHLSAAASEIIDSDVEIVGSSTGGDDIGGDSREPIFPPDLMNELAVAAREIELELCTALDAKGEKWRAIEEVDDDTKISLTTPKEGGGNSPVGYEKKDDGIVLVDTIPEEEMKMPSRETAAKEEEERRIKKKRDDNGGAIETNFRYHEVASRCIGRIDSRYRMDQYPFNDPRVTSNAVLLPIIKHMLGGETGNAELVYAGLIFSFPGSQNQPWHQDGEPLFPEEAMLDVPAYAFNVFIPLDEITDEIGATEFVPGLLSDRQEEINEELVQWAMIESKWSAAGDHKASMRMVLGAEEDEWMSTNKVVAPLLRAGDVLIYDYRTCHRGTENLSQTKTRTMLYLMYARPWLQEHLNFGSEKLFGDADGSR